MRSAIAAILLFATAARADIAPMPFSGAAELRPLPGSDASNLKMSREDIAITLHDGYALIDGTFEMSNEGTEKTIKVGFPGAGVYVRGNKAHRPLINFQAWVDGKPVSTKAETKTISSMKGPPGRQYAKHRDETWHAFDAKFPAKKTTKIRVRYAVLADVNKGDSWSSDELFTEGDVNYVLATGARWSGSIGEAVLTIRAADKLSLDSVRIRDGRTPPLPKRTAGAKLQPALPSYAKRNGDAIVLTRKTLEPTEDDNIEIVFPLATPRPDSTVAPELWKPVEEAATAASK
ncbi:MAG: hypothetical protein ACJ790_18350 [Myxococcaceae bacterium]